MCAYSFTISHAVKSLEDVKFIIIQDHLRLNSMSMTMTVSTVLFNLSMSLRCSKVKKKNGAKTRVWGFYGVSMVFLMVLVSFSIHDVHH